MRICSVMKDGSRSYGNVPKGERLQKLYDSLSAQKEDSPSARYSVRSRTWKPYKLAKLPVRQIREEELEHVEGGTVTNSVRSVI